LLEKRVGRIKYNKNYIGFMCPPKKPTSSFSRENVLARLKGQMAEASKIKAKKLGKPRQARVKDPLVEIRDLHRIDSRSPNYGNARLLIKAIERLKETNAEVMDNSFGSDLSTLNNIVLKINREERLAKREGRPAKRVELAQNQRRVLEIYTKF
jgi:hypothetical protein